MPSDSDDPAAERNAAAGRFVAALTISMMSIAVGVQTGLLTWRAAIQLTDTPQRRALHD